MSSGLRRRLAVVLIAGLGLRLALVLGTGGLPFDLGSIDLVRHALGLHPLHVYTLVNHPGLRWPYPSGFFAPVWLTGQLSTLTGIAFTRLIRLLPAAADLAVAWVLQDALGRSGASDRTRLTAAAIVALGPLMIAISGYNGQLDSVAILPELLAVVLWDRVAPGRRAVLAGGLIGVGCAIKTFPIFAVVVLLPSCRSRREATMLVGTALLVPLLALAPWLLTEHREVTSALSYRSLAGQGGLSLLVQPDLAGIWLGGPFHHLSPVSNALQGRVGSVCILLCLAAAAAIILRARLAPVPASVLLWLTTMAFSIDFNPRYALWGIPFFILAGYARAALALQLGLIVPTVLLLREPYHDHRVVPVYVVMMLAVWVATTVAVLAMGRRALRSAPTAPALAS